MDWEATLVLRIQMHLPAPPPNMINKNLLERGFTLVEMAIVLVVVGLLVAAFLAPLSAQIDQKNNSETRRLMDDAKEALMGYAITNKHLPCPDTNNDGIEDFVGANCTSNDGNLPWATLSLPNLDSWEQPLIYHVSTNFAVRSPSVTFGLGTNGNLRVCTQATCNPASTRLTTSAIAVIVSRGKNIGVCPLPSLPACADERENDNGNNDFVSHEPTAVGTANEYDDLVVWLSSNVLLNRMVTSGQLP